MKNSDIQKQILCLLNISIFINISRDEYVKNGWGVTNSGHDACLIAVLQYILMHNFKVSF